VKFFDKPVSGIANWREIYPQLEKQYCDLAFKGSLDFLETDVGTGNREIKVDKNAKEVKPLEITSCCDRSGLHIFLRAETSE